MMDSLGLLWINNLVSSPGLQLLLEKLDLNITEPQVLWILTAFCQCLLLYGLVAIICAAVLTVLIKLKLVGQQSQDSLKPAVSEVKYWFLPLKWLHYAFSTLSAVWGMALFFVLVVVPIYFLHNLAATINADLPRFLYGVALCLVAEEVYWRAGSLDSEECDILPSKKRMMCCIIGAGPEGLCVAKELVDEGHMPVIFEKEFHYGGIWHKKDPKHEQLSKVFGDALSNFFELNPGFSDFPMGSNDSGKIQNSTRRFMKYIREYTTHFKLEKYIRYGHTVVSLTPKYSKTRDSSWIVTARVASDKDAANEVKMIPIEFDYVAVCTGKECTIPHFPHLPQEDLYEGNIRHISTVDAQNVKNTFGDKRVLCVGQKRDWLKLAMKLVWPVADSCDITLKSDSGLNELTALTSLDIPVYGQDRLSFSAWRKSMNSCIRKLRQTGLYRTKGDDSNKEKLGVKPAISKLRRKEVIFADGTSGEYDEILLLTGFEGVRFPFLPPPLNNKYAAPRKSKQLTSDHLDRYLGMFHPKLPRMVFIGFSKGVLDCLVSSYEMQARWFALIVSEKRLFPDLRTVKRGIEKGLKAHKSGRGDFTPTSWQYTDYIASKFVHCSPNPYKLLFTSPIVWLKVFSGRPLPWMYRFQGPHNRPGIALKAYHSASVYSLSTPPTWLFIHPLFFFISFGLEKLWGRIPLVGPIMLNHLHKWYTYNTDEDFYGYQYQP